MAETKEMKVRIQLRNGTYQNLQDSTLNLMKGEIAVVIDSTNINKELKESNSNETTNS